MNFDIGRQLKLYRAQPTQEDLEDIIYLRDVIEAPMDEYVSEPDRAIEVLKEYIELIQRVNKQILNDLDYFNVDRYMKNKLEARLRQTLSMDNDVRYYLNVLDQFVQKNN